MGVPLIIKIGGIFLKNDIAMKRFFIELNKYIKLNDHPIILVNGKNSIFTNVIKNKNLNNKKNNFFSIKNINTTNLLSILLPNIVNIQLLAQSKNYDVHGNSVLLPDFFNNLINISNCYSVIKNFLKYKKEEILKYINFLKMFFKKKIIPFICSMGFDKKGNIFNINSDIVSMILTIILKGKLIFLTDVSSVLNNKGQQIKKIYSKEIDYFIKSGIITDGMIIKVQSASITSKFLKKPVKISGWHYSEDLFNLFNNKSIGTKIYE
ncbi:hypothetical protein [Buchnera aphidicola]|uniref:Acetylglutamate kinase n=1 Tax=Buchnera aphidicola subsp. Cinara cedri (strain Cc) TaxID=372461 RepID=Q058D7_BUCCC|nr:hypothetical protein [Buchnera aphidicola]ABJ90512.1 acetylglutamate kinase [Buchnera aphidicola BCc]